MQESTVYRSIQKDAQKENLRLIALNLLRGGVDTNLIASSTGLSPTEVQQLQPQQLNSDQKNPRSPGIWKGKVTMADDFDE